MILKIFFIDEKIFAKTNAGIWLISLLFTQNIIYFIAIQLKLKDVGISFFKKSSGISSLEFEWLRKLFILFSSILVIQLFVFIGCRILDIMLLCIGAVGTSFILTFVLINNIILFGLSKPYVFELKEKYQNTPIKLDNKQAYLSQIIKAFEKEEVYLDPLLSLERLSKKIGIPKNYLSQIINDYFSMNFNELINKYRIQKVTDKLKNEYTGDAIINIAYEVGFNAKSTFNTAFKKFTEMTPSQYLMQKSGQLRAS
ncbi:helix-turn-helix domain-containing protein [Bacteroidota bacterium]